MKFDRPNEAEEMMKKYASRKAAQVGRKVGSAAAKLGFKAGKWLIISLCSLIGLPAMFILFAIIILLILLPSSIFSSTLGIDASTNAAEVNLADESMTTWETDAQNAIEERKAELERGAWWADFKSLIATGKWGNFEETFKTEYANADDIDEETGESISTGYFSSSNRLVAIIDEAFRSSVRDDKKAMKAAKKAAQAMEEEYRQQAEDDYPKPDDADDYRIDFEVAKDDMLDDAHYVYNACYIMAATSAYLDSQNPDEAKTDNADFSTSVRYTLDTAFEVTGLDDTGEDQVIIWESNVNPTFETEEEEYIMGYTDPDPDDPDSVGEPIYGTRYIVTVTAEYSVTLKSDFKDIVNDYIGLEDLPENASEDDMSCKDMANVSAMEIMKFYAGYAALGDAGLPLPAGSYTISSQFGGRDNPLGGGKENHGGVDLAAPLGTPIYAVKDGTAQVSGHHSSYGNAVTLTHEDGTKTRYAHMSSVVVSDGESVTAGQVIGFVGKTGSATGNHLHFEVIVNGSRIDPMGTDIGPNIEANAKL